MTAPSVGLKVDLSHFLVCLKLHRIMATVMPQPVQCLWPQDATFTAWMAFGEGDGAVIEMVLIQDLVHMCMIDARFNGFVAGSARKHILSRVRQVVRRAPALKICFR